MTNADKVWNRATLQSGGAAPKSGDRALAVLLLVHGLVMNGGVHHALESAQTSELRADPTLSDWTDENEAERPTGIAVRAAAQRQGNYESLHVFALP
jgi:hypothetical protein